MTRLALDVARVRSMVAGLVAAHPELADDDTLRADVIEGATDAHDILERLVAEEADAATMADAIGKRIAAMTDRRRRYDAKVAALRSLILDVLDAADLPKVVLPDATLSVTRGRLTPHVADADALPDEFVRVKREPDKRAIAEAVKAGTTPPGVVIANGSPSLTIRRS